MPLSVAVLDTARFCCVGCAEMRDGGRNPAFLVWLESYACVVLSGRVPGVREWCKGSTLSGALKLGR